MNNIDNLKLEDILILKECSNVSPKEISGLPVKRKLDFTIDLLPGAVPSSKAPYRMNILELNEFKSQLKNLFIRITLDLVCFPRGHLSSFLTRRMQIYNYV